MSLSNTASQLRTGLENRIRAEEALKQNIIQKINDILRNLRDCDRTGLPPAAAAALDLTQQELDDILALMSDTTNLDNAAAENVVGELRRQAPQLRKNPDGTRPRTMFNRFFGTARPAGPAGPSAGPSAGPAGPPAESLPAPSASMIAAPPAGPEAPPSYSSVAPQVKSGWSWPWSRGETVQPIKPTLSREERERRATRTRRFAPDGPVPNDYVADVIDDEYVNGYSGRDPGRNTGRYGLFPDQPLRTQQNHIGGWKSPKRKPKRPRKTRKN